MIPSPFVLQDIRHSLRLFAARPAFTAVIVLALAVGIGSNVALFSVVDGLLLAPLPYDRPAELVEIEFPGAAAPLADFRGASSLSGIAGWLAVNFPLGRSGESRNVFGMRVSGGLFRILGVRPFRGRLLADGEEGQPVAMVSFQFAQSNPGDSLIIGGERYAVVGVLPENFVLGVRDGNIFVPARMTPGRVIGRLAPGVTVAQAQAEVAGLLRAPRPPRVRSLNEALRPGDGSTILLLQAAVGLVLLITCANVANLLLVASTARRKEFAIRAAIGAGRWNIARRLLVESALLGMAGAAVGLALAASSLAWVEKQLPGNLIRMLRNAGGLTLDAQVLTFSAAAAILAVLLFGLAPAIGAFRLDLMATLRGAASQRSRAGAVLVAGEAALSLMLLIGAGLTIKSLLGLEKRHLGFSPDHVLRAAVDLLPARYPQPQQRATAFTEIATLLAGLPGVEVVGLSAPQLYPFGGPRVRGAVFEIEGRRGEEPRAEVYVANPDYLRSIRLPLLRGRWFTARDDLPSEPVCVLGDLVVRRYWNGGDPVGRRVRLQGVWMTVVGVVGDVRNPVGNDWQPTAYRPFAQAPQSGAALYLRAAGDPMTLIEPVRRALRTFDPTAPEFRPANLEKSVGDYLSGQRFTTSVLSYFAAMGLLLAALGVYGVMRHWVVSNTRDLGIRIAMGASALDVIGLVLERAGRPLVVGLALGFAGALALQKVIAAELHDVSPVDPAVIGLVVAVLAGTGLLAALGPARRASRVDPLTVLKHD